ncbi:hypothetical protein [Nocardiopsis sp. CNT312]|uniref:hypothetical protein n=1 Tax=Nocardiopsis sp. CNT312 TaxID=1137268 RepID=UPI001E440ED9|nr:hypothetical protein [Nocardiopsis sp. CNT312]
MNRLRAAYRHRGWTVWHGDSTGQYWAAHTGRMVLLSGGSVWELAAEIEKVQPSRSAPAVPAQARRRRAGLRLPPRPKPRGYWGRPARWPVAGHR